MSRRPAPLDEKIKKAQEAVAKTKKKYDAAIDELEKLITKQKQLEDKKLLEAYHSGNKTADEIIAYIQHAKKEKQKDERS